jgi:hypothetical protein
MPKKYVAELSHEEREELRALVGTGKAPARKLSHARVLLKADTGVEGPGWTDEAISEALEMGVRTIENIRKLLVTEGLEAALNRRSPKRQYQRKLDGRAEAHLVALACGSPPAGRKRWTMRLLADKLVELEYVDSVSHVTTWRTLKKTK